MTHPKLIVVEPGARVKFRTEQGTTRVGNVVNVDDQVFPGKVVIRDEEGELHEVAIGVGWPD